MALAEVTGVISAIITIIEASIKIYRNAADASDIPQSFRDAASRLPLIQDTLKLATDGLAEDVLDTQSHASLSAVLEKCTDRVAVLLDIFQLVITPARASRAERYLRALKTIPQAEKVETLMEGIMADLQLLATNQAVKAATRKQMERLISRIEVNGESCRSPIILNNSGSGRQFVHNGTGHQNVATDTATQINGSFSGGTFSFYQK
ncbi:SesA domain-containing protein [Fusarium keratoplasticum]|nr:SesA domain-containing protein [Fusarium keratoplasticum]